jgi:hypothetical protein
MLSYNLVSWLLSTTVSLVHHLPCWRTLWNPGPRFKHSSRHGTWAQTSSTFMCMLDLFDKIVTRIVKYFKNWLFKYSLNLGVGGMAQVIEHLPSRCKILTSNSTTTKKIKIKIHWTRSITVWDVFLSDLHCYLNINNLVRTIRKFDQFCVNFGRSFLHLWSEQPH